MAVTNKVPTKDKEINDPRHLKLNDTIHFKKVDQPELSNKNYQITRISTYDFDGDLTTLYTLTNEKETTLYLSVVGSNCDQYLSISKKLTQEENKQLFDEEDLEAIIDGNDSIILERDKSPKHLEKWTSPSYAVIEEDLRAYEHKGDLRNQKLPHEDESMGFDYYLLEDSEKTHALEIEHHNDGSTTIYATTYHSPNIIEKMTH